MTARPNRPSSWTDRLFRALLAPAAYAFRADLSSLLKTGGRGAPVETRGRLGGALVVAQVAVSLAMLVSGGLFVRSLDRARHIDLGFQPDGILLASTEPGMQGYNAAQRLAFYRNVWDRIAALPGVEGAAWISWPPFAIAYQDIKLFPEGQPPDSDGQAPVAFAARVSPEYFATARVPLVEGRAFEERDDANAAPVAIVNQTLARQFWPGQSALGAPTLTWRLTTSGACATTSTRATRSSRSGSARS